MKFPTQHQLGQHVPVPFSENHAGAIGEEHPRRATDQSGGLFAARLGGGSVPGFQPSGPSQLRLISKSNISGPKCIVRATHKARAGGVCIQFHRVCGGPGATDLRSGERLRFPLRKQMGESLRSTRMKGRTECVSTKLL